MKSTAIVFSLAAITILTCSGGSVLIAQEPAAPAAQEPATSATQEPTTLVAQEPPAPVAPEPVPAAVPQSVAGEVIATLGADGIQRVDVVGGSYFFKPDHIVLKVNVPVEMTVTKQGKIVPHNIVASSPEAGIEFSVNLATTARTVKFTPTKVGKFPIYCSKKMIFMASHREKGMEGVLDVRE
jgi:plastocyanin